MSRRARAGLTRDESYERAVGALTLCGIAGLANRQADTLGLLDRKRLELARALGTGPSLLLLDEIGGGLTDAEATELVEAIQELQSSGIGIVWIEHIVHVLVQVAKRLICMNAGKIIADGDPAAVMADPRGRRGLSRRSCPMSALAVEKLESASRPAACGARHLAQRRDRRSRGAGRRQWRRQDDAAARHRRRAPAELGHDPARRPGHHRRAVASPRRHGHRAGARGPAAVRADERRGEPAARPHVGPARRRGPSTR